MMGSMQERRISLFLVSVNVIAVLYFVVCILNWDSESNIFLPGVDSTPKSAPRFVPSRMKLSDLEAQRMREAFEARQAVEPVELITRVNGMKFDAVRPGRKFEDTEDLGLDRGTRQQPLRGGGPLVLQAASRTVVLPEDTELPGIKLDGGKLVLNGPEVEDEIIPGRTVPEFCHAEPHTDYDGAAVKWGATHQQESAADCCQACVDHAKNAKEWEPKCNIWVFCPSEEGCFVPDIYEHKEFECWLKQADEPKVNHKGNYSNEFLKVYPFCPKVVAWVAGVL